MAQLRYLAALTLLLSISAAAFAESPRTLVVVALRKTEDSPHATQNERRQSIRRVQQRVLDRSAIFGGLEVRARWNNVHGFSALVTDVARRTLEADPDVLRVDDDVNGAGTLAQSVPLIGGDTVHANGWNGSGVTVAVLDTGVASGHSELEGAVVAEACFCTNSNGTGCCPNGSTSQTGSGAAADDHGHGTHVTGIVASRGTSTSPGVAPAASIVAVKVLDSSNSFNSSSQIVSALDWILDNRPEVGVVNMSLGTFARFGGTCDSSTAWLITMAEAIDALIDRGTTVAAASMNNADATTMSAPACIQNTLAVGAVYDANIGAASWGVCTDGSTAADQIACFSNASTALDLLAPGSAIVSLNYLGGTTTMSGTSMATPHIAGGAAVLMQVNPSLTPAAIESAMESTGTSRYDSRNGITYPRLNLLAAVNYVDLPVPTNVVAAAASSTSVDLSWTAALGASGYRVYRSSDHVNYSLVGSPSASPFTDSTASSGIAYLYKVRAFAGFESKDSNLDLATTATFTDANLVANTTPVKVAHFTQLLTAVNAVRQLAGLGAIAFTAPAPSTSVAVSRQHLLDLRSGLDAARQTLALSAVSYTDSTIVSGSTRVKTAHVAELRSGVQ